MKFSVVTISFNQAEFLAETIQSVLSQREEGIEIEYIVVDPGSTDGSRAIIDSFGTAVDLRIYEPDAGPADGLNRGFSQASGDIFCYLNSDDTFEPGAISAVRDWFIRHPDIDVAFGHAWAVDRRGKRLRRVWSEPYHPLMVAYGAAVQIQPSTFIRRDAFKKIAGFNVSNRCAWDGELLVDLFKSGARFKILNRFLSNYRLHATSITNSGRMEAAAKEYSVRRFEALMGRGFLPSDRHRRLFYRMVKHVGAPRAVLERILRGPMYRRGEE